MEKSLEKLVKQHAQTSGLLGVDFVPAYRRGDAPAPAATGRGDPCEPRTPEPVEHGAGSEQPAPCHQIQTVEVKPEPRDREGGKARLAELLARYEREAPHKKFVTAHTKIVFGDGDPAARLVFVGEAPGEEEDRMGIPFVGRSGQLLNKMIAAMGLRREDVYICNVLKTRPPDNATPTSREIEVCEPYLREQLAIIGPSAIVTLGLPAAKALLKTQDSMSRLRGRWRSYRLADGTDVPLMPTFHPAYVLRNYTEATRGQVWSDLRQVMDKLGLKASVGDAPPR